MRTSIITMEWLQQKVILFSRQQGVEPFNFFCLGSPAVSNFGSVPVKDQIN